MYRGTLIGCTVILMVVLVLTGTVVGIAPFFSYSLFHLYSPYGVWTTYDWDVTALDLTAT